MTGRNQLCEISHLVIKCVETRQLSLDRVLRLIVRSNYVKHISYNICRGVSVSLLALLTEKVVSLRIGISLDP